MKAPIQSDLPENDATPSTVEKNDLRSVHLKTHQRLNSNVGVHFLQSFQATTFFHDGHDFRYLGSRPVYPLNHRFERASCGQHVFQNRNPFTFIDVVEVHDAFRIAGGLVDFHLAFQTV